MSDLVDLLLKGLQETIFMTFLAAGIGLVIGLPLGAVLTITSKDHVLEAPKANRVLGALVNMGRSFPSLILIILLLPLSRLLVGTTLGPTAALVPLSVEMAPFIARITENAFKEVDKGKIEAALSMGTGPWDMVRKVLIPEAMPALVRGTTLILISTLGLTAIAGCIGAGGLGSLAIRYGYQRFRNDIMFVTVSLLIVLVTAI
ncbi:MAG TPA: methionine ABC transporter permease, partial [Holophaga sp.]|nr:methionine ABC transporter permease [Holophaga sp.]